LECLRYPLERRRAGGALGVLRFEELDVVEHQVGLVLGQRVELAQHAIPQDLVHGSVSSDMRSSTGLPRNRVRPGRTRAVTWTVASGVRARSEERRVGKGGGGGGGGERETEDE